MEEALDLSFDRLLMMMMRKNAHFHGSKYILNRLKERKWTAILCRMGRMLRAETLF